jgi:VWFA-related protein
MFRFNPVVLVGGAALAVGVAVLSAPLAARPGPLQQPTFRSSVDLIAVDVQVVDSRGTPVLGLTPESFQVTIDGRRRRVVSADLVQYAAGAPSSVPASGPVARNIWPDPGPGGPERTFVIAIDAASFQAGTSVGVLRAAASFVEGLPGTDRVGVFTLPHGAVLSPTTDRAAVRRTLNSIVGTAGLLMNRFNLTPAEVVDITAADGQITDPSAPAPARGGAPAPPAPGGSVLREVQLRECRNTNDQNCLSGILMEADAIARQIEEQAVESMAGMNGLLRLLGELPGRKMVVLMSAGMPVSDRAGGWHSDGGEAITLGHEAARSNATIYAVHIDQGLRSIYSAEIRSARSPLSRSREREVEQRLLNEFAVASGGAMFSVATGDGELALDRLLRETSTVYLLGVAPDTLDMDGRPHELRVRVDQRGTTIRSRKFVVLRPSEG